MASGLLGAAGAAINPLVGAFGAVLGAIIDQEVGIFGESERIQFESFAPSLADEGTAETVAIGSRNRVVGHYVYISDAYGNGGGKGGGGGSGYFVDAVVALAANEQQTITRLMFDSSTAYSTYPFSSAFSGQDFTINWDAPQGWGFGIFSQEWYLARWHVEFKSTSLSSAVQAFGNLQPGAPVVVTDDLGNNGVPTAAGETSSLHPNGLSLAVVKSYFDSNGFGTLVLDLRPWFVAMRSTGTIASWASGVISPTRPTVSPSNYPWQGNQANGAWTFQAGDTFWQAFSVDAQNVEFFLGKNEPQVSTKWQLRNLGSDPAPALPGMCYVFLPRLDIGPFGLRPPNIHAFVNEAYDESQGPGQETTIGGAIVKITGLAGIPSSNVDVSELPPDPIYGLQWQSTDDLKKPLSDLMVMHDVAASDRGGVLRFHSRFSRSRVDLDPDLLDARPFGDSPASQMVGISNGSLAHLPRRVNLRYYDVDRDNQYGLQHGSRDGLGKVGVDTERRLMQTGLALDSQFASRAARRIENDLHEKRQRYRLMLPTYFLNLEETDLFESIKQYQGRDWKLEIDVVHIRNDGLIEAECIALREDPVVQAGSSGLRTASPTAGQLEWSPLVTIEAFELSGFREYEDGRSGVYVATSQTAGDWPASEIYLVEDGDVGNATPVGTAKPGTIGYLVGGTLLSGDAVPGGLELGASIRVQLYADGELSSQTTDAALAGKQMALVGREAISWTNATLQEDGTYILTGIVRGMLRSADAIPTHYVGERFVLLDEHVVFVPISGHDIGDSLTFAAAPSDTQLPLAPQAIVSLEGLHGGTSGYVTLTGEDSGSAVTSVDLHDGSELGGVFAKPAVATGVSVTFKHSSVDPGALGTWTARLKKWNPETGAFEEMASLEVNTS